MTKRRKTCEKISSKGDVMRRGGFTMIELIFVIVILGILAAVALPKFIGVSEQARNSKVQAFVGTLNRTVGPTLWSKSIAEGKNGSITSYCKDIANYVDVPSDVLSIGNDCTITLNTSNGVTGSVNFQDGTATESPRWTYTPSSN
jgi:prepilin-type N-terminal cleavage/methylation domain-containing protein